MRQVLRRDPELAQISREMLKRGSPEPRGGPGPAAAPAQTRRRRWLSNSSASVSSRCSYLAGMLSTAEIAAEMYLSVNTVKTHLRSIYRKLSAAHRGEAVRRARQLKLI